MALVINFSKGAPPYYPTSSMVPSEFWRKQPAGDPDNTQTLTVKDPDGNDVKRDIERNWENPVYIGPREDDPNHGLSQHNGA